MANLGNLIVRGVTRILGDAYANKFIGNLQGNADTATSAIKASTADSATSATSANKASIATAVQDYGTSDYREIKIGYNGSGLSSSTITHAVGFTDGGTKIKDISKDEFRNWLATASGTWPITVSNATNAVNATNADTLDGAHYQNILERWYSGHSSSGTATGWFRIAETLTTPIYGITFLLAIQRSSSYIDNESYLFSISISYNGGISITQLSGYANSRLITKIRVDWSNGQKAYVDLYINTSSTNNDYYWYTVGCAKSYTDWTANPTLVGHAYEFTTVQGCKSDRGFTGNLTGNASSATNAASASTIAVGQGTADAYRSVYFANNSNINSVVVDSKLKYNPSSGDLKVTKINSGNPITSLNIGFNNGYIPKYVEFPEPGTLVSLGHNTQDHIHDEYYYFLGLLKWAYNEYKNQGNILLIGNATPNSVGNCQIQLYSSSPANSDGIPQYASGLYESVYGTIYTFSSTKYNYRYGQINANNANTATNANAVNGVSLIWNGEITSSQWIAAWESGTSIKPMSAYNTFISMCSYLDEGSSDVTDGTMFITSYATDNGFADPNGKNKPYKRKASLLWNYINNKCSSIYATTAWVNDNFYTYSESDNRYIRSETDPIWTADKVNYYTKNECNNKFQLKGAYLTEQNLQGYATTTWVNSNYYTCSESDSRYMQSENDPVWTAAKGNYYTKTECDNRYQPKGTYLTEQNLQGYATQEWVRGEEYLYRSGGTMDARAEIGITTKLFIGNSTSPDTCYAKFNCILHGGGDESNPNWVIRDNGYAEFKSSVSANAFYASSDIRLKNILDDINIDFDKLKLIPKKYYTWKGSDILQLGTIAQDIQKIYPEVVSKNENGYLSVDYSKLSIIALAAIDKLNERIKELECQIKL